MHSGRPAGPTGSLWDPIDIQRSLAVRVFILPSAKNRQPPRARLTEKSQRHKELLNGSLMLPVVYIRLAFLAFSLSFSLFLSLSSSFHHLSPLLVRALLRLSSLTSFPLSNASPFFRFDHLHSRVRMCSRSFEAAELLFTCLVGPPRSSWIKLDNRPPGVKETKIKISKKRKDRKINTVRRKKWELKKLTSLKGERDKHTANDDLDRVTIKGWLNANSKFTMNTSYKWIFRANWLRELNSRKINVSLFSKCFMHNFFICFFKLDMKFSNLW